MSVVKFLLNSAPALARQGISRVLPTGEERVIRGLRAYGDRFFDPANAQGLTIDPRTGKDVIPGQVVGNMMSRIPNPPNNANVVRNVDDLVNYVQSNPAVMRELQTGGYAGGWFDPAAGGLVFDPSRRYLTRGGAVRAGTVSGQKAGFDLSNFEEFPVNNQALRQAVGGAGTTIPAGREVDVARRMGIGQAAGSIVGALTGGASAAGAVTEDGNLSATDVLGVLGAGAVGALGGRSAGRSIGASAGGAGLRGVIAPAQLRKMRDLGVREGTEGGINQAGLVAKNRALAIGVPPEKLANIKDGEREVTAFRKAYNAALEHFGGSFGAKTTADLPVMRQAFMEAPKVSAPAPAQIPLDARLRAVFTKKKTPKNLPEDFDNVNNVQSVSEVSPEFAGIVRPVRHAKNMQELAKLARKGEVNKLSQAVEDIQSNFLAFVTADDLAQAAARGGNPVFYTLHSLATRARAAALGMPVARLVGVQGPASAMSSPVREVSKTMAAFKLRELEDLIASGRLKVASYDDALQKKEQALGYLVDTGKTIKDLNRGLDVIEDDIIKFMKDPTSVPGIQEKVWTYLGTTASPFQRVVSTMDSWMMRAGFGNNTLSTADNRTQYQLMHEALNDLARRMNIAPATLQEIIWKNIRVMAGETGDAFTELFPRKYLYPNVSLTAKSLQPGMPSLTDVAKTERFRSANKNFVSKLIRAIKEDPTVANYIEIVGEDVQFTDEFFKAIDLF